MSQPKIAFLDIHGVLGRNAAPKLGEREIEPACVAEFNRIVDETGAKIVLTSSMRGLIHGAHMDLHGFSALLRTHGVHGTLFGLTDENPEDVPRWRLIVRWLSRHQHGRWVILDDHPDAYPEVGLTAADADAAIAWLVGVEAAQ